MWVIQNESLFSLPDDAPMPPNAKPVDLPEDFHADPQAFTIEGDKIVRARPTAYKSEEPLVLTRAELARIKAAIRAGVI